MKDFTPCPRPAKGERDPAYLRLIRQLDCIRCHRSDTEPHHCTTGRFSQSKVSDYETIPLCRDCHDLWHRHPSVWLSTHNPDVDYLPGVKKAVERLKARTV
jgi:hypothetical protein